MSACELMDPKMDALGDEPPQPSLEDRLARGDVPVDAAPRAARCVLDRLLALEVAWLGGASLHETVLGCAFARDAAREAASSEAAFCVAAAAGCSLFVCEASRRAVLRADIYEEEDFAAGPSPPGKAAADARRHDSADKAVAAADDALRRSAVALTTADGDDAVAWREIARHLEFRRALTLAVANVVAEGGVDDGAGTKLLSRCAVFARGVLRARS